MDKTFFMVSDIEMGQRDVMDDFSDDDMLVRFVEEAGERTGEVFLVLNGDIFDFLKMEYKGEHTRYISEEVSQWKLERVFEAHPAVFEAWRNFLKHEHHYIFFVIGNHDFDLVWPSLQEKIRDHLGSQMDSRARVNFGFDFNYATLHAEHGNFFDPFFKNDRKKPFVTFRGQKILNLPIGCHVVFSHLAPFKKRFPKEEQLYPRAKLDELHPEYSREIRKLFWMYAWKVAIDPWIHMTDPTYRVGYVPFIRHFFKYGLDFVNDERFLKDRLYTIARRYPARRIFALAHTHVFFELLDGNRHFLATDTWRDEYDVSTPERKKKPKSYAEIVYDGEVLKEAGLRIYEPGCGLKGQLPGAVQGRDIFGDERRHGVLRAESLERKETKKTGFEKRPAGKN